MKRCDFPRYVAYMSSLCNIFLVFIPLKANSREMGPLRGEQLTDKTLQFSPKNNISILTDGLILLGTTICL